MIKNSKKIVERLERMCVCCGENFKVDLFEDDTYRGDGHYFFGKKEGKEYWECDDCFWDLDEEERKTIQEGVDKVVDEYGDTLKMLGRS